MANHLTPPQNLWERLFPALRLRREEQETFDKYKRLASFLMSHFPPDEFDFETDEAVIQTLVGPEEGYEEVVVQGRQLLTEPNFPLREFNKAASNSFQDVGEARQWLAHILDLIEIQLKQSE